MEMETHSSPSSEHHHKPNRGLMIALVLTVVFGFVELYTGTIGNATVLIADAWHMFTDAISMTIAILIPWALSKAKIHNHKAEAVTAILCGLLLLIPCAEIVEKIIEKFSTQTMSNSKLLTVTAIIGLLINLASIKLVHWGEDGHEMRLSSQGVRLHILGDILGSVIAILVGITGLVSIHDAWADIIGSALLLLILLFGLSRLLIRSSMVLIGPRFTA